MRSSASRAACASYIGEGIGRHGQGCVMVVKVAFRGTLRLARLGHAAGEPPRFLRHGGLRLVVDLWGSSSRTSSCSARLSRVYPPALQTCVTGWPESRR